MRPEFEKQDKLNLMEDFAAARLMPRGAEANLDALTSAIEGDTSTMHKKSGACTARSA